MSTSDALKKFLLEDRSVRVIAVSLDKTWQAAQTHQDECPAIRQLLGDLMVCAALLAANLKFEGSLLLQLRGNGPVKLIVVECRHDMSMRATARLRRRPESSEVGLKSLLNADGQGQFSVILNPPRDTPGAQPYQGIVPLTGESVTEALETYMQQSEQLHTRLWLSSSPQRLAGLLVQRMPVTGGAGSVDAPSAEASWQHVQAMCETLSANEMDAVDIDTLTHRLFWQTAVVSLEQMPVVWRCGCNRERVANMLRSLGQEEVDEIVAEQGAVTVTCEFCATPYAFDAVDAAALFKPAGAGNNHTVH